MVNVFQKAYEHEKLVTSRVYNLADFYSPMYATVKQGFFKDEGLSIDLSTAQAVKTQLRY